MGKVVEEYLKNFSYVALALAVVLGAVSGMVIKRRAARALGPHEGAEHGVEQAAEPGRPVAAAE